MPQTTQDKRGIWLPNANGVKWSSFYPNGDRPGGTLIASATFTDGNTIPSSIYTGANWGAGSGPWGSATLSVVGGELRGTIPATDGATHGIVLSLEISTLNLSEVFIQFRAKSPIPHAIKFCKVHGQRTGGEYANCTFGLSGGGAMTQTSFGDGSGVGNDTAQVIELSGIGHQLGRNTGATVLTPQNSAFTSGMWGSGWHDFKLHVKFNSGTSAINEVPDGSFYVEIDGDVYVNATGLFNRHYSNQPIDYISFYDVMQDNDSGIELWYDDIRVSTGGWV